VRLFAADGRLLEERTTPDTTLTLPLGRAVAGLLVEATALDPLLEVIATSGLIEASTP
jgi:hypothetical protein